MVKAALPGGTYSLGKGSHEALGKRYEVLSMEQLHFNLLKGLNNSLYCIITIGIFAGVWFVGIAEIGVIQWLILLLYFVMHQLLNRIYEGYNVNLFYVSRIFYSQGLTIILTNVCIYLVMVILGLNAPNLAVVAFLTSVQLSLAYLWSRIAKALIRWYSGNLKAAIIYSDIAEIDVLEGERPLKYVNHLRYIQISDDISGILTELEGIDAVYATNPRIQSSRVILDYCLKNNIMIFFKPDISEVILTGAKPIRGFNSLILGVSFQEGSLEYKMVKRFLDLTLATVTLIVVSPLMLLTALAIFLYDSGPVIYRQTRLTKNGRPFTIYKFRSMRVDAEKDGTPRLSSAKDERITPVGKFIRMIRFDELPQLFNILKGDMSIVGPRPERPEIMAQYVESLPEFPLRLQVKAGLTGFAQIYGRYDSTPVDKLNMDLYYIAHPSIVNELRIIVATLKVIFLRDSSKGVTEGQVTALRELNPKLNRSPGKE